MLGSRSTFEIKETNNPTGKALLTVLTDGATVRRNLTQYTKSDLHAQE